MYVNLIAPRSNVSNNIYSYSELIYLSGFLEYEGFTVKVKLMTEDQISDLKKEIYSSINILVLQWDGPKLIDWLYKYRNICNNKTILFGITAQIYGDYIVNDILHNAVCVKNFCYQFVADILNNSVNEKIYKFSIEEICHPKFDIDGLRELPMIPLISSRGCKNHCSFCAINCCERDYNKYLKKDGNILFKEIQNCMQITGVNLFYFTDSCFITDNMDTINKTKQFANLVINSNLNIKFFIECRVDCIDYDTFKLLKDAGLKRVLIGAENFNKKVLERYNKNITVLQILNAIKTLHKLQINMDITLIMFEPNTSKQEVIDNIRFILNNNLLEFMDVNGVFRRMILIPQNKMQLQNKITLLKNQDKSLPDWLMKSYYYRIFDPEVEIFEDIISSILVDWTKFKRKVIKNIVNIKKKKYIYKILDEYLLNVCLRLLDQ